MSARTYDLPWMPLHVADWLSSATVASLSMAGECAYVRLLMHQWRSEAVGLPCASAALRALIRWHGRGWEETWALLEPHFLIGPDGRRRNARLEAEREKLLNLKAGVSVQRSVAGQASAAKRRAHDTVGKQVIQKAAVFETPQVVENQHQDATARARPVNNPKPQTTASKDEAVSATASTGQAKSTADTTAAEGMADQFEEPAHRDAYLVFRRAHPRPHSYDGTLGMMLHGGHGPGGRRVTIWQLGSALADAAGDEKVVTFNPNWFRGFLANAPQERPVVAVPARYELPGAIRDPDTGAVVWYTGMPEYLKPGYVEPTEEEAAP